MDVDVDVDQKDNNVNTNDVDPSTRILDYLNNKKSIKHATVCGISFLRYCIAMIDEELAIKIVKNGIDLDINEPWDNGQTPLHFACQMDLHNLINAILSKYTTSHNNISALNFYCVSDDFLVQFNDFQCGGKTILHYCCMNGSLNSAKLLLKYENNILKQNKLLYLNDFCGNSAIDDAIIYKKLDIAQYLIALKYNNNNVNIAEYIKQKQSELSKKRLIDSKKTRLKFESCNNDLIFSKNDILNRAFTVNNLFSILECDNILNIVIKYGNLNGWTSSRHRSYSTIDIPTYMISYDLDEKIRKLLYNKLYPKIIHNFEFNKKCANDNNEYFDIGIRDLFFVKYDILKQNSLSLHRDGSLISFNILLNNRNDFDGGGTYIKHLNKIININKGDCCMHSGKVLHAGNPITRGERYILVGFLDGKVRKKQYNTNISNIQTISFQPIQTF